MAEQPIKYHSSTGQEPLQPATDLSTNAPVGKSQKWWVLIAIGIGTFMSALDGSVVNTILPIIQGAFSSQVAVVEWVVTIYLLVLSGLLLSFGRLGDLKGHKPVYIAGFVIFLASSALCGFSPSITWLILFRAVQALGAAMLSANSPAILTKSFPSQQRGQALGIQATMTYLGLTVGPVLGGLLAEQFSWRSVFYINIPVGLLALGLSLRYVPSEQNHTTTERFDLAGALIFIAGLTSILFGLNQGHALGWTSPVVLSLLGGSILLFGLFIRIERSTAYPMLDLNLFNSRLFSASALSAILNYICVYSILFLMPFYLIQGRAYNPAQAGLLLTAMPIIMAVVAPISGTLSDRIGTRQPAVFGMVLLAVGLYRLASLGPTNSPIEIVIRLGSVGLGIGIFISPNNSALMGAAPHRRQGIAAGILATARNVGMVLGVGLTGAIFTTYLSRSGNLSTTALFAAIHASFMVTAAIAAIGAAISMIRPS